MDRSHCVEKLKEAISEMGGHGIVLETIQECPSSDLVFRTSCYVAFFTVVERAEKLEEIYLKAQSEIVGIRSERAAGWPRDINLILLTVGDNPADTVTTHKIIYDRHFCRKFVLNMNGVDIGETLANLPFWPPTYLLAEGDAFVAAGVREAARGYDARLIADLATHSPGADGICEKIRTRAYRLKSDQSIWVEATPISAVSPVRTKLEGVDITDFRGIRRLRREDMSLSGNVIFIYGTNGVGKTSIADAVEWGMSGQVSRLERMPPRHGKNEPDPIINVFSENAEARVSCYLAGRDPILRIKRARTMEGLIGSRHNVEDRAIIDHVVGTTAPSRESRLRIDQLKNLFRSSHMLGQNDIRQFLEKTTPTERFDILTNMIGAEEFVRFRKKVVSVLSKLRSDIASRAGNKMVLQRQLEDVSARLRDRQNGVERLSDVLTSGRTPDDLATELLNGLKNYHCSIDMTAIDRVSGEQVEHRLELITLQAEAAIRGKKTAIEDVLVRLKSLEEGVEGYIESQNSCQYLSIEIANSKGIASKGSADLRQREIALHDRQANLQMLKVKQSEVTRRYADLVWLKDSLRAYFRDREALGRMKDSLANRRKDLEKAAATLDELKGAMNAKRARMQEVEKEIATAGIREQALRALVRRLPQVQLSREEAERFGVRERQFENEMNELRRNAKFTLEEVSKVEAHVAELQNAYKLEAARHDLLTSFLAKLAELVRSSECPLCGRDFVSLEEARDIIKKHLSGVPVQLGNLAHDLAEARKESQARQMQGASIAADMRTKEDESIQVRLARNAATKIVQDFVVECAALGLPVLEDDAQLWQSTLEQALRDCVDTSLRSEATGLRDSINNLSSALAKSQKLVDELRQGVAQEERQLGELLESVQGCDANIIQRGFDPNSLPEESSIDAGASKATEEAAQWRASIAQQEVELEAIKAVIAGLRESIRKANEDVASKEAQLRQYETTCSHFVSACRAIGINPKDPIESIRVVKLGALNEVQSLSDLEGKRQVLQQVTSLGRLKDEVALLARDETELMQKVEESVRQEAELGQWVSHLAGLEAEIGKRQVDVVGAHLKRLEPTTQRLYKRLNPHPVFGNVSISVNEESRELDVEAGTSADRLQRRNITVSPATFFSDAQMNVLAITVFLAGALRQRWSGLSTILLDDPIQQMDEMNVYAFLDLIRGLASERQFIIFTCSQDFYLLALDRLVCLNESKPGSFLAYRLDGMAPGELKVHCDAS